MTEINTISEGQEATKNFLINVWMFPKWTVEFEIGSYVFDKVFSIHDVAQLA